METTNAKQRRLVRLLSISAALVAAIAFMLFTFIAPMMNSGANDLPLAVAGPDPMVSQIENQLEQQAPGSFEVIKADDESAVRDQIMNREAIGGIVLSPAETKVLVAGAAGSPYKPMLTQMANSMQMQAQAQQVELNVVVEDVAPLSEDDPQGAGLSLLALPLAFGGMASGIALSRITKRRLSDQLLGVAVVSIIGGLVAAGILYGYGIIPGSYLQIAAAFAFGIAAISLTVQALDSALPGFAGIGIAAILMVFVANPLSGIATGPAWLPAPWGTIGQTLPIGATGTLIRNLAFFDANAIATPLIVLGTWFAVALIILCAMHFARKSQQLTRA